MVCSLPSPMTDDEEDGLRSGVKIDCCHSHVYIAKDSVRYIVLSKVNYLSFSEAKKGTSISSYQRTALGLRLTGNHKRQSRWS
jgi:hypothetical protein